MKCPNCGQEIQAGHLYCEKCGLEIQIVPDFEPEIENSITETLSTVAEEIDPNNGQNVQGPDDISAGDELFVETSRRNWVVIALGTAIAVALIGVGVSLLIHFRFSAPYQLDNARKYAQQEDYETALTFLNRAIELDAHNVEQKMLKASYCYRLDRKEQAAEVLQDLIEKEPLSDDQAELAYESIVSIYDELGRYEEINELLLQCQNESIVTMFQNYMAMPPEFSYAAGSYDEVVPLRLSANTTGTIYYTLDGSEPSKASLRYTAPIFMESGTYQVSALFINNYGIESQVVKNWYKINLTVPQSPIVLLESGTYELPTKIDVLLSTEGTIYYTTDGSEPNIDSLKFTQPIDMPLGQTNYKFVVISEEGVASEVVNRTYEFRPNTDISVQKAISNVTSALYQQGVLKDLQGHSFEIKGKYVFTYDSVVEIPELGYYYKLNEYVESDNGIRTKTERLYAVELYTGAPNRLIYDENGNMGLIALD